MADVLAAAVTLPDSGAPSVAYNAASTNVMTASQAAALAATVTQNQVVPLASPESQVAASIAGQAAVADATHIISRAVGRGGSSSLAAPAGATDTGIAATAAATRLVQVNALQGAAAARTATDQAPGSASADAATRASDLAAASAAPVAVADSASSFATSAAIAAATVGTAAPRQASTEAVAVASGPATVAESAEKLMNQVVQTIRTFQTSDGPGIEARVSDPTLGDVTLIVIGRAGEVVQAQLVARDRLAADALSQAVSRMNATGNALAGVSITVRSERGGDSAMGGRAGGNPFEAAGWTSNGGYGAGGGQGGRGDQGQGVGSQNTGSAGSGPGNGAGSGFGTGNSSITTTHSVPAPRPEPTRASSPVPRTPLPGGPSLDIRA